MNNKSQKKRKEGKIHLSSNFKIGIGEENEMMKLVDEMRVKETIDGVTRASMVRIAIREAHQKRFGGKENETAKK